MTSPSTTTWLTDSKRRLRVLAALSQPLTPRQISRKTDLSRDTCSRVLAELKSRGLVDCLNPSAGKSRLYWLTPDGHGVRAALDMPATPEFPNIDFGLYCQLLHSQRTAVVLAIDRPSRPSEIRRRALLRDSAVTMNTSNVRDILRWLIKQNLARHVPIRKRKHPLSELTDVGKTYRELLVSGETRIALASPIPKQPELLPRREATTDDRDHTRRVGEKAVQSGA